MRYAGCMYDLDLNQYDHSIKDAILTEERVAVDWVEAEEGFHLLAYSRDRGRTYEGTYGTPRPEPLLKVRLTRLLTFDDVPRLVAYWFNVDTGDEMTSLLEFEPV